jgi:hypothetical protein
VAQGGQLGARADRAEHKPRPVWFSELIGHLAGQRGTRLGELPDPVSNAVLGEVGQIGAEGVGLHRVGTRLQVAPVHGAHDVRASDVEDLVAALQPGEVTQAQRDGLQHRAHCPIGDQDTTGQDIEQRGERHAMQRRAAISGSRGIA